ncbi:VOC family protein [Marimonas lutisalis]|uniref:VOC family protein n=1 Tax=Marimonas lutisalis TaxID=2545756 RepID=UPI0019621237|nr:VOC family protein [Marimonas lutisalis]
MYGIVDVEGLGEIDAMPEMLLHHISYPVRDVEVSASFYEDLFKLKRLPRPPFPILGVWLGCGDRQIHLVLNEAGTYRSSPSPDIADVHFAFCTDDFEGLVERLEAAGFREDLPEGDRKRVLMLREGLAGFPQLYLLDPDLNTIEVNAAPMPGET